MKAVIIVAQEKFNKTEFNAAVNTLNKYKISYQTASVSNSEASGYGSFVITPDISIREIVVTDYDCLIIIGGSGCREYLWKNDTLHDKIKTAYAGGKILAAICLAPVCLIYSGIMKNSFITAFKTSETIKIIQDSGNIYKDINVYTDGNIITANGPKASSEFCGALIKKLEIKHAARLSRQSNFDKSPEQD